MLIRLRVKNQLIEYGLKMGREALGLAIMKWMEWEQEILFIIKKHGTMITYITKCRGFNKNENDYYKY